MRRMLVTGWVALAVLATGSAGAVDAPDTAPDALLSAATRVVTESLSQDRDAQARSRAKIAELVESTLLPLFDFRRMTQLATAQGWRLASPAQQSDLVAEFRTLLVRTYSSALMNYRDQPIEYRPLRASAGETDVTVNSIVGQRGPERLTIDYDMEKTQAGWKVYDVKIAGVSLVTTYRSSFAEAIREGGVDGLIRTLSTKNRQG